MVSTRLPHLPLRMQEHSRRALFFAERLEALGLKIIYPGLKSHPQHEVLLRISNVGYGSGGIFCVDLGDRERANAFLHFLQNEAQFGFMVRVMVL